MSVACGTSVRRIARASKRFRSTKGASKARRDQINAEIRNMRALLPICEEEQERLSYLHSMAVICTFIRKSVMLTGYLEDASSSVSPPHDSFLQALPGFIVAFTKEGKLVYVSENVQEYLGLSMVDVLQGDSFYEMMDDRDGEAVKLILGEASGPEECSFVCRMHTSKAFRLQNGSCCSMLVKGRFQDTLFVALCSPTADRLQAGEFQHIRPSFHTLHRPDMRLTHAPYSVWFHLGFSASELIGRSWYELLHPDDVQLAAERHSALVGTMGDKGTEMLLRLQRKDLSWIWIYVYATTDAAKESIACVNHVLSDVEAIYLRDRLPSVCPLLQCPIQSSKPLQEPCRKARTSSESSGTDMESVSAPFFSTPPYSPTSSHSSDFLSEGYSVYGEQRVCNSHLHTSCSVPDVPSESFTPLPFSDPSSALPSVCPANTHLVPIHQPMLDACEASADCLLHQDNFSVFPDVQEAVSSLMTPEQSPTTNTHFLYSETEQAEISTLAHQIRSLACSFDAYSGSVHTQFDVTLCWPPAPEPLVDETIIDCILRDLDAARGTDGMLSQIPIDLHLHDTLYSRPPHAFSH